MCLCCGYFKHQRERVRKEEWNDWRWMKCFAKTNKSQINLFALLIWRQAWSQQYFCRYISMIKRQLLLVFPSKTESTTWQSAKRKFLQIYWPWCCAKFRCDQQINKQFKFVIKTLNCNHSIAICFITTGGCSYFCVISLKFVRKLSHWIPRKRIYSQVCRHVIKWVAKNNATVVGAQLSMSWKRNHMLCEKKNAFRGITFSEVIAYCTKLLKDCDESIVKPRRDEFQSINKSRVRRWLIENKN